MTASRNKREGYYAGRVRKVFVGVPGGFEREYVTVKAGCHWRTQSRRIALKTATTRHEEKS